MSDWKYTTLADVADVRVSNVDKKTHQDEYPVRLCNYMDVYGSIAVDSSQDLMAATASAAEIQRFKLYPGDVVITKDSETPDDIAIPAYMGPNLPSDVVCGYHLAILRPRSGVDGQFLSYLLRLPEVNRHFACRASGSTRYGLSLKTIHSAPLRIPDSETEQKNIAALLAAVDAQLSRLGEVIAKSEIVRAALIQDALSAVSSAPLEPLSKLATVGSGVTLGRKFAGPGTADYPYLRVANVQDGHVDLTEVKTLRLPQSVAARAMLQTGDVLMNEGGDFDKLGRGAVWRGQVPNCLHQNHVFRVRCNQELLLPDFLALWAASEFGKKFFMLASKQSTNLASINSTQLKKFPVLRPSPDEQRTVLKTVEAVDSVLELDRAELAGLRLLKQGLARDLLTGKVRVPS